MKNVVLMLVITVMAFATGFALQPGVIDSANVAQITFNIPCALAVNPANIETDIEDALAADPAMPAVKSVVVKTVGCGHKAQ